MVRFPKRSRNHFVFYSVQFAPGSQPASYPVDAGGSLSGDKVAEALNWPLSFHLVSGLRTLGVTNSPPSFPSPYSYMVCSVTTYRSALTYVYMKLFLNSLFPYVNVRPSIFLTHVWCVKEKSKIESKHRCYAFLFSLVGRLVKRCIFHGNRFCVFALAVRQLYTKGVATRDRRPLHYFYPNSQTNYRSIRF